MNNIYIPPDWKVLADAVDRQKGPVIVLGAPDTGKTTLAFYLARDLQLRGSRVAMIYADVGQCSFGPPATLGMALLECVSPNMKAVPGPTSVRDIKMHSMYFVGSTSPPGHLLQVVVGLKKLVERAHNEGAEVVVIDTSGFTSGGAAWELKFHKIELINVRHVVALQRRGELENILIPYEHRTCRTLHRLKVYEGVRLKSYEQRREYRRQKFFEYFQGSVIRSISLGTVRLINPINISPGEGTGNLYNRLLVGLNNDENFTLGLGVVGDLSLKELKLITPVEELVDVKIVRLGSIRLDENWYDSRAKFDIENLERNRLGTSGKL